MTTSLPKPTPNRAAPTAHPYPLPADRLPAPSRTVHLPTRRTEPFLSLPCRLPGSHLNEAQRLTVPFLPTPLRLPIPTPHPSQPHDYSVPLGADPAHSTVQDQSAPPHPCQPRLPSTTRSGTHRLLAPSHRVTTRLASIRLPASSHGIVTRLVPSRLPYTTRFCPFPPTAPLTTSPF